MPFYMYNHKIFFDFIYMYSLINSFTQNHSNTIILLSGIIIVLLVIWIIRLEVKFHRLTAGKSGNLEESITHLKDNQKEAEKFMNEMEKYLTDVEKRLQKSVQAVETVRFNAFDGVGANQSFATALINQHGDGVIFSSLYGRERTSVFSKPLKGHNSEHGLSDEEKQAVKKAKETRDA
jgi:hypothetical protein